MFLTCPLVAPIWDVVFGFQNHISPSELKDFLSPWRKRRVEHRSIKSWDIVVAATLYIVVASTL